MSLLRGVRHPPCTPVERRAQVRGGCDRTAVPPCLRARPAGCCARLEAHMHGQTRPPADSEQTNVQIDSPPNCSGDRRHCGSGHCGTIGSVLGFTFCWEECSITHTHEPTPSPVVAVAMNMFDACVGFKNLLGGGIVLTLPEAVFDHLHLHAVAQSEVIRAISCSESALYRNPR